MHWTRSHIGPLVPNHELSTVLAVRVAAATSELYTQPLTELISVSICEAVLYSRLEILQRQLE